MPAEHAVISKERRSGSYHLSAYYLAKGLSELPLALVLPSIFLVITYWCTGLNGWASFFGILLILLLTSVVAQVYSIPYHFNAYHHLHLGFGAVNWCSFYEFSTLNSGSCSADAYAHVARRFLCTTPAILAQLGPVCILHLICL